MIELSVLAKCKHETTVLNRIVKFRGWPVWVNNPSGVDLATHKSQSFGGDNPEKETIKNLNFFLFYRFRQTDSLHRGHLPC